MKDSSSIAQARRHLRHVGRASAFAPAGDGPQGGASGGTAIAWPLGLPAQRIRACDDDVATVQIATSTAHLPITIIAIYGLIGDTP